MSFPHTLTGRSAWTLLPVSWILAGDCCCRIIGIIDIIIRRRWWLRSPPHSSRSTKRKRYARVKLSKQLSKWVARFPRWVQGLPGELGKGRPWCERARSGIVAVGRLDHQYLPCSFLISNRRMVKMVTGQAAAEVITIPFIRHLISFPIFREPCMGVSGDGHHTTEPNMSSCHCSCIVVRLVAFFP